jgi:hypothetical protein
LPYTVITIDTEPEENPWMLGNRKWSSTRSIKDDENRQEAMKTSIDFFLTAISNKMAPFLKRDNVASLYI